ncbi:MAG: hypothetical protein KBG20_12365 [Caldilineaceae bacterium]|nr:hypothetical protein [Caldilineaceae bacterium]MBP8109458.1 hypothetical protein [Caldilineaceae bacterium]MBP8123652.1 hypothetical protein [Caldilineaceae bacterium]MBP9073092.1 hypothetical protein [Caldilineaceae bacterium]
MVINLQQYQRYLIRIFFILVILAGLVGAVYGRANWSLDAASLDQISFSVAEGDWVDLASTVAEGAIQIFQGMTGTR